MSSFEPKQFGKYFLIEKLAVGGMAEIYKAKTFGVDGFEKLLVVKRILPHCSADKDFIAMLVDEAKLSVTLSHANVVQVYDLGKVGDDYFISMEYINGVNLRDVVYRLREQGKKIPEELAAYAISEVCKGLDYAHRKTNAAGNPLGIVHRDVSPQNILISYEGEVKMVDFGIAKAAMNISHTMAGILKGKIAYMSPEQALGKTIDHRADIFSTGIVLYEALTSEKLFTGESQFEVLKKIRTTKIDTSKLANDIPDGLKAVLVKALAYFPKDRYQSAGDMQIDLTKYIYTTHVDFTPQKLATFIKELFHDEINKQLERGLLDQALEAKTSSINIEEEALQENIVHREESLPTIPTVKRTDSSSITGKEFTAGAEAKRSVGKRLAGVASVLIFLVGIGFAYVKFLHPVLTGQTGKTGITGSTSLTGTANIFSEPSGAKIFLDGVDTDLISPAILENLKIGRTYRLKLSKDQFADQERHVKVESSEPISVDIELSVAAGLLDISSEPPEADVAIDGESTGKKTPVSIADLMLNSDIKITLSKEGYKNYEQTIRLTTPKPQTLSAKLSQVAPAPAPAPVAPPPPPPPPPKPKPAEAKTKVKPEPKPKPEPKVKPEPKPEPETELALETTPAPAPEPPPPAAAEPATLKISSEPSGAEVFINSEYRGTTPITMSDLKPGTINVLINKEGRIRSSQKVTLSSGENRNLGTIRLDNLYGSVSISSAPSRATVVFDGETIGAKTPLTIKKVRRDKEHSIKLMLKGYQPWSKTFELESSDDKRFDVTLDEE